MECIRLDKQSRDSAHHGTYKRREMSYSTPPVVISLRKGLIC